MYSNAIQALTKWMNKDRCINSSLQNRPFCVYLALYRSVGRAWPGMSKPARAFAPKNPSRQAPVMQATLILDILCM